MWALITGAGEILKGLGKWLQRPIVQAIAVVVAVLAILWFVRNDAAQEEAAKCEAKNASVTITELTRRLKANQKVAKEYQLDAANTQAELDKTQEALESYEALLAEQAKSEEPEHQKRLAVCGATQSDVDGLLGIRIP